MRESQRFSSIGDCKRNTFWPTAIWLFLILLS
jgi:hypothetical protein